MGGVAGGSVVDVDQRSEVSGSSFEVLSHTKISMVQLYTSSYIVGTATPVLGNMLVRMRKKHWPEIQIQIHVACT